MAFERGSGILLHPSSLPSRGGIGDLGPAAHEFVEWLATAKQTLWQVLPLSPTGLGNSPYSATSAFAGNVLLVSLELLARDEWIETRRLNELPDDSDRVDWGAVYERKLPLLREAAQSFLDGPRNKDEFFTFCRENAWWLEDFVLFDLLRKQQNHAAWTDWPDALKRREANALEKFSRENRRELDIDRALQFAFWKQWRALHQGCRERGVRVMGDVAIFVSMDSADVWSHPEIFQLDKELAPTVVSGVPPDFFSETGQRWGNPLYRWDVLGKRGYDWWIQRMRWATQTCDIIRLDHFRGFEAYWEIPAAEETAENGKWVDGPKGALFDALCSSLGKLPFVAEDLGTITEGVHALREHYGIPGMRILQFGWSNRGAHMYLPHKYEKNTVVYTGTHDNDTTLGWWKSSASAAEKQAVQCYLGASEESVAWTFVRAALGSVADLAIIPLQDVLGLDSNARMNVPSSTEGNWGWRFTAGALTNEIAAKLAALTDVTDRAPLSDSAQESEGKTAEEVTQS